MENNDVYWSMNFDTVELGVVVKIKFFGVFYVDVVVKIQMHILHF